MEVRILNQILEYLNGNGLVITDEELLEKAIDKISSNGTIDWDDEPSSERCPKCFTELCHIDVEGKDVFGCPKCKKEINRDKAVFKRRR